MADYLTRVAEAVRDACAAEAFMETTLAVEYVSAACPGEIISNMILNNIDLQAVIASVPRPEPVFVPSGAKYFAYDQEVGFDLYDTANEARKAAQESIDEYRSEAAEGWNEAVENVCWGVVLGKTREVVVHDGYDGSAGLAGCGRPVDYVLVSEPVAAQPALPNGWKLVTVEPTDRMLDAMVRALSERGVIDADSIDADYAYRAMLAAVPEAPQTIQCNACNWIGSSADALYLGGREPIGPLCPECHETTGPADDAATLREQNATAVAALKAIDDLTGRAGFEFGGPLAVAMKEGLGDRDELLELAGIAGGYFEAISKHAENALASVKGGK